MSYRDRAAKCLLLSSIVVIAVMILAGGESFQVGKQEVAQLHPVRLPEKIVVGHPSRYVDNHSSRSQLIQSLGQKRGRLPVSKFLKGLTEVMVLPLGWINPKRLPNEE